MWLQCPIAQPGTSFRPGRFFAFFVEELVSHRHPPFLVNDSPLWIEHHFHVELITISFPVLTDLVLHPFMLRFIPNPEPLLKVVNFLPVSLNDSLTLLELALRRHILTRLQYVRVHLDVEALSLVLLSDLEAVGAEIV